jgi:hypothetical protein
VIHVPNNAVVSAAIVPLKQPGDVEVRARRRHLPHTPIGRG